MWRCADPDWLCIAWDGAGDVHVTRGRAGDAQPRLVARIDEASWFGAWRQFRRASDQAAAVFTTFEGEHTPAFAQTQAMLREACVALYELIARAAATDLGTDGLVVLRSPLLRSMSLARLVAVARPELLAARRLPWDLPTSVRLDEAPALARAVTGWLLPTPANLTILAPVELELERTLPSGELDATSAARIARWMLDIELALGAARAAGAEVIRPATARELLAVIEGGHRRCVQIFGHIDARGVLHLDGDAGVSLHRLHEQIARLAEDGWSSPVRTMDLSLCNSDQELMKLLRLAGVEYLSVRTGELHIGAAARWLRALYERELFDGRTPIAHAWLLAALQGAR